MGFTPPDYGLDINSGKYPDTSKLRATYFRDEKAKRPVNVRNIRHNTASNLVGNYNKKYEVFCAFGRKENNLYFRKNSDLDWLPGRFSTETWTALASANKDYLPHTTHPLTLIGIDPSTSKKGNIFGGLGAYATVAPSNRHIIVPPGIWTAGSPESWNVTYAHMRGPEISELNNESIIVTRFSAPGGPEIQTSGYLDAFSKEYSVHNVLPFRNLTVREDSGEIGTIRSNIHLNNRKGLNSLLTLHSGRQGIEAEYAKRSVRFDGTNNILFSNDILAEWDGIIGASGTKLMTFSFWINLEEWSLSQIINFDASVSIKTDISSGNKIQFSAYWSNGQAVWRTKNQNPFRLGIWNHICIVYDATSANTGIEPIIYVNGEQEGTQLLTSIPTGTFSSMGSGLKGTIGLETSAGTGIKADMSEVAIWNKILTASDVKDIYNAGFINSLTAVSTDLQTGLQLWYRMGENHDSAHKIFDRSGNARHSKTTNISPPTLIEIVYDIDSIPSYGKQHRNTRYRLLSGSTISRPILLERHDNMFVNTPLPASDFQYSWINQTLKIEKDIYSGRQNHYRYSPIDGFLSSSSGFVEAIIFPSSSNIT